MATPAATTTFVYVGNAGSNEVYVLRLERGSGDLTLVEKAAIPGIDKAGTSTPMAVSPDRRVLYVATRGEPKVAAGFAIEPARGTLRHLASGPLPDSMAYIATDRTGRFLLGASYPGHKVTVSRIEPPGTVQAAHQVLAGHPNAHSILADAANRHVLVPTLGNDRVNLLTFDAAAGTLAAASPAAVEVNAKAGPRHFRFHPSGRLVYVLGELDGAVYVFDYDAGAGRLTPKQTVSALPAGFEGKPAAADLHVTPTVGSSTPPSAHRARWPGSGSIRPAGRSRPSAACRPSRSPAASASTRRAAISSPPVSSRIACRAMRSTRPAAP
jgi:6-phosphogluconolactonase